MTVPGSWQRLARGAGLLDARGEPMLTIFAEMSALAASTGAINLGQGFPDEDGPQAVLDAARRAIADGHNQYPPGIGVPVLREAITGQMPDVTFQGLNRVRVLVDRGLAVPMDGFIAKERDFDKQGFHQAMYDIGTQNGKVYALPFAISLPYSIT